MSLAALSVAAALVSPQAINLDTGLGVLRTCEDEGLRLVCLGYIKGVTDGIQTYSSARGFPAPYCAPAGATMEDFRLVLVEDLRVRRDYWGFIAPAAIVRVLNDAFPCPTSGASPNAPGQ